MRCSPRVDTGASFIFLIYVNGMSGAVINFCMCADDAAIYLDKCVSNIETILQNELNGWLTIHFSAYRQNRIDIVWIHT